VAGLKAQEDVDLRVLSPSSWLPFVEPPKIFLLQSYEFGVLILDLIIQSIGT